MRCESCGKEFEKLNYNHKFCSDKCKYTSRDARRKYTHTCPVCGKEFNPHRRKQKFCTRACAVIGRSGITKKQGTGPNTVCGFCGESIRLQPQRIRNSDMQFCNMKCFKEYKRISLFGDKNPNYRGAGIRTCVACGREYKSYNKNRRYCAKYCADGAGITSALASRKRGHEAEIRCYSDLKKRGYHVSRSAASRGEYDVIAISNTEILLIQVKYTTSSQPSRVFKKRDIKRLSEAPAPIATFVKKQLWTWVDLCDGQKWMVKEI